MDDPSEVRGDRGRNGRLEALGVAGISPDCARAAPEVAGTQAPRFGFLVGWVLLCFFFFYSPCCAACARLTYAGVGGGGGAAAAATAGELSG